jgi:hypothetical protein
MRAIAEAAMAIDELAYNLDNISTDQRIDVESLPDAEIVSEARYVLDLFVNPTQGHINGQAYRGEEGTEQRQWARMQVKKLKSFIKKYS